MISKIAKLSVGVLVLLAALIPGVAFAQGGPPPLPQAFFGTVEVNGQPAPAGAQIEGRGAGVKTGIIANPLEVTAAGLYGGPERTDPKLGVQGTMKAGQPIEFYVDGVRAQCARPGGAWQDSFPYEPGVVTILNLRVGAAPEPSATVTVPVVSTATVTATAQPGITEPAATATRQGVATLTPTTTAVGSAAATATLAVAQVSPTPLAGAIVSTPTGQAVAATEAPATAALQAEPATVAPVATQTPVPPATAVPPAMTPTVAVAKPVVAATAKPVLQEATAPTSLEPRSESASQTNSGSGGMIALWAGLGVLLAAVAVGVIIKVRGGLR
jgi:hypothetical protein